MHKMFLDKVSIDLGTPFVWMPIFTVQDVSEGSALEHNTYLDYSCDAGYFKPLPNPLQCKV
jgi:hypothetical protein